MLSSCGVGAKCLLLTQPWSNPMNSLSLHLVYFFWYNQNKKHLNILDIQLKQAVITNPEMWNVSWVLFAPFLYIFFMWLNFYLGLHTQEKSGDMALLIHTCLLCMIGCAHPDTSARTHSVTYRRCQEPNLSAQYQRCILCLAILFWRIFFPPTLFCLFIWTCVCS